MLRYSSVIITALLLFGFVPGSAQWERLNVREQGWMLNGLHVFDTAHWVAVGDYGVILTTMDGFRTYRRVRVDTKLDFNGLAFLTPSVGIAAGADGITAITTDGGETWGLRPCGFPDSLWSIARVDDSTAVAVGKDGFIIRTANAGKTWNRVGEGSTTATLFSVAVHGQAGVAVGASGTAVCTTDGGTTWISTSTGITADLWTIAFSDDNSCIAGGDSAYLVRSEDAGVAWLPPERLFKEYRTMLGQDNILSISFASSLVGYAGGFFAISPTKIHYMRIFRTDDGGRTWRRTAPDENDPELNPSANGIWRVVRPIDSNRIAVAGYISVPASRALYSRNGGESWELRLDYSAQPSETYPFNDNLLGSYFFSTSHGVVSDSKGYTYRTRDAGQTWTRSLLDSTKALTEFEFFSNFGVASGSLTNEVYTTIDSGKTWQIHTISANPNDNGRRFKVVSPTTAYCLVQRYFVTPNSGYRLVRTTDAGETWHDILAPATDIGFYYPSFPEFTSSTDGWIMLQGLDSIGSPLPSYLYHTTNGGATWFDATPKNVLDEDDRSYQSGHIQFVNAKTGWILLVRERKSPLGGVFLKTTDGGVSWQRQMLSQSPYNVNGTVAGFKFFDENIGFLAAGGGKTRSTTIYRTTDGGDSWQRTVIYGKYPEYTTNFFSFSFPTPTIGYAVGDKYSLLRYAEPLSTGVDEPKPQVPYTNVLISPNPASESFTVHCRDAATITVRDVFGRIINQQFEITDAETAISTTDYTSGVYFVEVTGRDNSRIVQKVVISR